MSTRKEQVIKVIWHKAGSPPHMDGSVVFSRWRQCALHLIHASLSPSESTIQTASRSVQRFLHSSWQAVPILIQWAAFPSELPLAHGGSWPWGIWTLIYAFLGSPESTTQTASRSVQPFFAGLTIVTDRQTDRQTDHATLSLTVGPICVRSTAKLIQRTQWACYVRIALCMTVLSYKLMFIQKLESWITWSVHWCHLST